MPTPARTVQFRSAEDVVAAYENMGVPMFAIWAGKQLLFPFEGDNVEDGVAFLEELLPKLAHSAGIYMFCVYKHTGKDGICNTTPYNASFNFQLNRLRDEEGRYLNNYSPSMGNELISKVEALSIQNNLIMQELAELRSGGVDEDEVEGKVGAIERLLNHPIVTGMLSKMFGEIAPAMPPAGAAQKTGIAGVDEDKRIEAAVNELKKVDPELPAHLEKLARVAKVDAAGFKMLLAYLDGINV
jgi:hypothetical protein